jgi:hypothetical protein
VLYSTGDFWDGTDVQQRTTVQVDSVPLELITAFVDHQVLHTIVEPPAPPPGAVTASMGGPFHICYYIPLTSGIRRVDLRFEESAGGAASYARTFEPYDDYAAMPAAFQP